ncbi:SpoIIE family protein phosphatase [Streptomyces sp. NPDC005969]|uniref:SpoIIE family protein phosphatase n=1 Tax=Streptomyces sp. NPDC005969 TaxID=3156722 RepID=UPI0033E7614D
MLAVVVLLVTVGLSALILQARNSTTKDAEHSTRAAAIALAADPATAKALDSRHPTAALQPVAENIRKSAGFDYVVVFSPQGIRYTHPNPELIGKHVYGGYRPALKGPYTSSFKSPLGWAVDSTAPVRRPDGSVAGLVSVGVTVERLGNSVQHEVPLLLGGAAAALCLGMGGAVLVRRRLYGQTRGLGPDGITRMYEQVELSRERLQLLYDAGVRVGTTLDVVRTAHELAEVVIPRFADFVTVELADPVLHGDEPSPDTGKSGGPKIRRMAMSGIRDDPPLYPLGSMISFVPAAAGGASPETGQAARAADLHQAHAWRARDRDNTDAILAYGIHSLISAPLQARGLILGMAHFWRAEPSPPFGDDDVAFAEELASRAAISLDNARRFTREHTMAEALQRSLLPRGLPEQSALDLAYRYLPAHHSVAGDWFDIIPLSGFRVALVVGDVVGHGLHAAATMGRLCTAVRNFSALDLPPDELLARLDDLVISLDQASTGTSEEVDVTGATCLYVIYDPVSGDCTMGRAGHPAPALVRPDGSVDFVDLPAGPPLGVGGLPFEVAEQRLEEGTRLVLYTDGLVHDRHRSIDDGLAALRGHLVRTAAENAPEVVCGAVFDATAPPEPRDDVVVLVARTRLFKPGQVATWDVPADPAAVSRIRSECVEQLSAWGLDGLAFTAELILSELITNAIRYGTEPIHVRMLRDRTLVCEVSDGSSTSPHLRYAATTDEGGRGLFLVARLAERWGTRYTPRGKVIWCEQSLVAATEDLFEVLAF